MREDTKQLRVAGSNARAIMNAFTANHNFTYKTREAAALALRKKTANARALVEDAYLVCKANGGATPAAKREYYADLAYIEAKAHALALFISNCQF